MGSQVGYTVIEVFIVMVVIGILGALVFANVQNSNARGRDAERTADMDTLHSRLEEFFSDYGAYPNTLSASALPGVSTEALTDPNGVAIVIESPVTSQVAAEATANPTVAANYKYIPYPTGCGTNSCTGYVLKTFIESPTATVTNPYMRLGLNNN